MNNFTTEEERAAFVATLKLIWQADASGVVDNSRPNAEFPEFNCHFKIAAGLHVHFFICEWYKYIHLFEGEAYHSPAKLSCQLQNGRMEIIGREAYKGDSRYLAEWERDKAFTEQWRETFRRNCWLSGFEIECTLHEQVEWHRWIRGKATKAKWVRIWQPEQVNAWEWEGETCTLYFDASLEDGVNVVLSVEGEKTYCTICTHSGGPFLAINADQQITQPSYRHSPGESNQEEFLAEQRAFAEKWLPAFRRNAWLSGCTIETNRHDEVEWNLWLREQPPTNGE